MARIKMDYNIDWRLFATEIAYSISSKVLLEPYTHSHSVLLEVKHSTRLLAKLTVHIVHTSDSINIHSVADQYNKYTCVYSNGIQIEKN